MSATSLFRRLVLIRPPVFPAPSSSNCHQQIAKHSTQPAEEASTDSAVVADKWIPIYRFPYIKTIVGLNKLKVYQAALTSISIPVSMGLEGADILPAGCSQIVAALGITGTMALSLASLTVGRNVIGFAYVDRLIDPTRLRLAVPNFWGVRRNIELPADSIAPQQDVGRVPLDLYMRVRCTLTAEDGRPASVYKLVHRHGEIQQSQTFTYVFGEH